MILSAILQGVLLWFYSRQFEVEFQRVRFILFYSATMTIGVFIMKILQAFQGASSNNMALFFPAAFMPLILTVFVNRRAGALSAVFKRFCVVYLLQSYWNQYAAGYLNDLSFSGTLAVMVKQNVYPIK